MLLRGPKLFGSFVSAHARAVGVVAALGLCLFVWLYYGVYQPPAFFPVRTILTIEEGSSLRDVADLLSRTELVHNKYVFMAYVTAQGGAERIQAGDYYFDRKLTMTEVAYAVTHGEFGLEPISITIPEGATTYQMAELFREELVRFDPAQFTTLATEKEGYLYPDTYEFRPNATTLDVLERLERTFYERLSTLEPQIATFGKPIHEIVTMASLLEKEAYDFDHKRTIAGVLWKRLEIGMPLQVDAVFGFIERRETFSPLYSDLEVESPYNTYKYPGLPPGPIGNPSLDSLRAAVEPVETDALFYLHGNDGRLHASRTYEEHLRNKSTYLR